MKKSRQNLIEVSADAELRLNVARDWIQSHPTDTELLLISNSTESANDLHLSIVATRGVAFGVKRMTLNVLASRLAQRQLGEAGLTPATNLSFTAVVARAIHSLQSQSALTYFAPVATKPGFTVAVSRTLAELRMNEIDSASLKQLSRGGTDLAAINDLVVEELKNASLSDRAILYRTAINAVDLKNTPLALIDVTVHSELERQFVEALAAHSSQVLATVPGGDDKTIANLERSLNTKASQTTSVSSTRSLDCVKQHLFEETAPAKCELDSTVKLSNWPGEPRECIEIVRSIQTEAANGVRLDQIAVLLNSPGEYRAHLEEAFTRSDIPAYFVNGITAPDPAGRAFLALVACAADGLSAKRFAEYLSLGEVPAPEALKEIEVKWVAPKDELLQGSFNFEPPVEEESKLDFEPVANPEDAAIIDGALRTPARWERLIVDSAVIGGKDRWSRRLNGLANELVVRINEAKDEEEALVESLRRQLSDLKALTEFALPLIDRLSKFPTQARWGEWLAHLRELSVQALRDPDGVMSTLADLEPMSTVGPVTLNEVQLVLEGRLRDLRVKPQARHYGCVFVGPVEAARGMSFRIVFVPGLAERVFPKKIVEDSILPDTQRSELSASLTTRRDQLTTERNALRLAVGSARERVYLSYPRIDVQQSRQRVPSFYALEALRAAEGELLGHEQFAARAESSTRARLGWPAPESAQDAIDEAEYDLAVLAKLVESEKKQAVGAAHYLLSANPHLARALRARSRRWIRRWTPNDGLVDPDELALAAIANHQFSARSFSATALQNFSSCPYRFFLSAILRLELRQELTAIEVVDPLTRGSLFHDSQFEILTRLKADGLLPLSMSQQKVVSITEVRNKTGGPSLASALELVDEVLERLSRDYEDRLAPAIPRVWEDSMNGIRMDLREWLRRMAEDNGGWIPDKFELSFGLSDRGPRASDPASVDDPVEIIGDLKLRGSIDMVERQADHYRVTDHKTGKARAEKETVVGGGKHLQPLLYALACQKLLNGKVDAGRLYYCTADGGYEDRVVQLNDETTQIVGQVLSTIRQGLVDGFLPAAPDKDACRWCDFLAVCGSSEESRVKNKPRDRLIQLKALRNLP